MRTGRLHGLLSVIAVVAAAHGCGDDVAPDAPGERVCQPGTVYSCVKGTCSGFQACSSDGTQLSRCTCGARPSAGRGGSGGAGGTRGDDAGEPLDAASDVASDASDASGAVEVCDNGADDDGDGAPGCAASDRVAIECKPAAPSERRGPIALRSADDATPSCDGELDAVAFEAGAAAEGAPASCSACSCAAAADGCASFVDFALGATPGSSGEPCTTGVNGTCTELSPSCLPAMTMMAYLATRVTAPPLGSCTPSTQIATMSQPTWPRRLVGCNPTGAARGGC